ncbi:MAG TPA: alpha-amylase family glycosyl hydrolase, partial [Candidatus Eisenbacteria bacterium]
ELYRTMRRVVRGNVPASRLAVLVARRHATFPEHAMPMRFVENHDEYRAGRRLGASARALAVFAALSGGCFLVYNGQEVGARLRPNLFDRDPINWMSPDAAIHRAWWRGLIEMRRGLHDFGAPEAIETGIPVLAAYRRRGAKGERIVAFNGSARPVDWRPEGVVGESIVVQPGSMTWPPSAGRSFRIPAHGVIVYLSY